MPDLDFARVIGRFGLTVGDTTADPDDDPDVVWCTSGRVLLTPLNPFVKVAGGSPVPWTSGTAVIECQIDADGYLTYQGKPYVYVVDLTSPKVNPQVGPAAATHKVTFAEVTAGGTSVAFPEFTCRLVAAGDGVSVDGSNDLTLVAPVLPGDPSPIYRGPAGPAGEPGPEGDVTPEALAAQSAAETAATNAADSASAAAASETSAQGWADAASSSAADAATDSDLAVTARDAAQGYATAASGSADAAAADAASIAGAVGDAQTAAGTATTAASDAATARDAAQGYATSASDSADAAAASAAEAAAGGVQSVNGHSPDAGGAVTLTAGDVGAATPADVTTASTADRARANHTGTQSLDTTTDSATRLAMTSAERAKLGGVAAGATANSTDAQLRDRSTHTGTQPASTITGLAGVATSGAYGDLTGRPALGTAASASTTDFATAAQGTKADGAAQKSANLSDLANASTARTNLGVAGAPIRVVYTSIVPARPSVTYVEWVGPTDPAAYAVNGDTWIKTGA